MPKPDPSSPAPPAWISDMARPYRDRYEDYRLFDDWEDFGVAVAARVEAKTRQAHEENDPPTARELIEDLLYQFAYNGPAVDGNPSLTAGGLSPLEDAFEMLGWDDPHPIPNAKCDEPGCSERDTCGWPSPAGYRRTCGTHMQSGVSTLAVPPAKTEQNK